MTSKVTTHGSMNMEIQLPVICKLQCQLYEGVWAHFLRFWKVFAEKVEPKDIHLQIRYLTEKKMEQIK